MGKIMTNKLRDELYKVVANTLDFCGNALESAEEWMIENDISYDQRTLKNNVFQCVVMYTKENEKLKEDT